MKTALAALQIAMRGLALADRFHNRDRVADLRMFSADAATCCAVVSGNRFKAHKPRGRAGSIQTEIEVSAGKAAFLPVSMPPDG